MYTPGLYKAEPSDMHDFIHAHGFGILVSTVADRLWATHIPIMLSADNTKLISHISRANKQWKHFPTDGEVMAIFHGAHSYVSSSWYDHENVPTWNYVAVHVYGTIRLLRDEELLESLKHLVDKYEKKSESPIAVERMSPGYAEREMKGAVGFEITITHMEGTLKLSQNRDAANHAAIVEQLEKTDDPNSHSIAELMKRTGQKK